MSKLTGSESLNSIVNGDAHEEAKQWLDDAQFESEYGITKQQVSKLKRHFASKQDIKAMKERVNDLDKAFYRQTVNASPSLSAYQNRDDYTLDSRMIKNPENGKYVDMEIERLKKENARLGSLSYACLVVDGLLCGLFIVWLFISL